MYYTETIKTISLVEVFANKILNYLSMKKSLFTDQTNRIVFSYYVEFEIYLLSNSIHPKHTGLKSWS